MSFALFGSCLIAERNDESGSGKQDKEWLFNKSETRGVFAGACFPEPAGVVYNVVRAFIYYDNGKIPFQHINRRPEPVFAIQLDNQQFYRHVLADEPENEPALLILDFKKLALVRHNTVHITTTLLKINILFKYPSDAFADKYSRVNILEFMLIWLVVRTSSLRGLPENSDGSARRAYPVITSSVPNADNLGNSFSSKIMLFISVCNMTILEV
jgi:hypothetical protein